MNSGALSLVVAGVLAAPAVASGQLPQPRDGWRIELVAEVPAIRHPSVVCAAPDGRIFVAEDPMDIATAHADAKEGRIVCLHPDGRMTTFADGLHAVFGMQYLEGKLYVLHNPKFSVFTDADGIGRERAELLEQTLPLPWALNWNDHVPANFRLAMDGFFYIAIGDKGLYGAVDRSGRRVDLRGGGIVRIRPDGTGLEVVCTGVRNILDVALDAEDEMFTYDNTDEHQWMGRLTHMIDGGFYGYPHDFIPQRPYTLWMLADYGPGAATGLFAWNDDALPRELRGNLLLADFGQRNLRRVAVERVGGTFRAVQDVQLFVEAPADFRPVGISETADGRGILICDWQHRDVKAQVSVGRLWKLTPPHTGAPPGRPEWLVRAAMGKPFDASDPDLLAALSHPQKTTRLTAQRALATRGKAAAPALIELLRNGDAEPVARRHALWALDAIDGGEAARELIVQLAQNGEPGIARQAFRQLGQRGVREALPELLLRLKDVDASLRLAAATALGRIGSAEAIPALLDALADADLFSRFAAFTALNRIGRGNPAAWPAIVAGLEQESERVREGGGFALRDTYEAHLVNALADLTAKPTASIAAREAALRILAALAHQLPEWKGEWWAYHPALHPPPRRTREWEQTPTILAALRAAAESGNERLSAAATHRLAPPPSAAPKHVIPQINAVAAAHNPEEYAQHAKAHRGDPWRGQQIFFDTARVACLGCHSVAGHGGALGPDLTLVAQQLGRDALIEAILEPGKAIREGYRQHTLELASGETLLGAIRTESAETVTLVDALGETQAIEKARIKKREVSALSLMPAGLHATLSFSEFADLIGYLESLRVDPRRSEVKSAPPGFEPLFNGRDLTGWKATPHWTAHSGLLEHDGVADDLWSTRELGNFELHLEWRWPDAPTFADHPVINAEGLEVKNANSQPTRERVLEAGDSGVFLRGFRKAQANLFCYPIGSGEFWEYRESLTGDARRAVTPKQRADRPIGQWNEMQLTLRGDRVTVVLNGLEVITNAQLPGIPARGPIGFQHEHGRIQLRNVFVKDLP